MNNRNFQYRSCSRCLMDTTTIDINFDNSGICNFCRNFKINKTINKKSLENLIRQIKLEKKNKQYDCIVGLSGGVDSCYVLIRAVELGLKPLAVHMDNGWNSELAQNNISNLIRLLKVDLYTHVIDWKEYRNMQDAFFKANVVDIELLYDNAMMAVNYKIADKFKIKFILSGMNASTEGLKIPSDWSWFKNDARNIKRIVKKFSNQKIKTFPLFGSFEYFYYKNFKKIKWISFPDYFEYNKQSAIKELENRFNFKKYPYKHYENIFTRFYQAYILPKKFGIDKRKLHLSNLLITNQLKKEEALRIMQQPNYLDPEDEKKDIDYFLKKMNWTKSDLSNYLEQKEISHLAYGSEKKLWQFLNKIFSLIRITN